MARRFRRKGVERAIARRRIERLFALAHERSLTADPELADRSVALARRLAMRYQTGLPPAARDRLCRSCNRYLAPGATARVRVRQSMVRTTCLRCGRVQRRPYRAEQKARRLARAEARLGSRDAAGEPAPSAGSGPEPSGSDAGPTHAVMPADPPLAGPTPREGGA